MIVTKNWLNEWVDLSDKSIDDILQTLNNIGLEVAEHKKLIAPKDVVVGKVVSCQKHPNADKLNLCEVDIGDERVQIVCGANNVKEAEYVAVAKVGATLPGDFKIKPAKLRGIESFGMICSSSELGFEKIEDGIMILDESIGEMVLGKELREYNVFNDDLIEIELTANRGDCLSVLGIARELATAFKKLLKSVNIENSGALRIGIGRVLKFNASNDIESSLLYRVAEKEDFFLPFLIKFRLSLAKESFKNRYEAFGFYVTYSTGVITRVYDYNFFEEVVEAKKDELNFDSVYGKKKASVVGVIQYEDSKAKSKKVIIEFSFIDPKKISKKMFNHKIESDWSYYRSSRGSEPRLHIAESFFLHLFNMFFDDAKIYEGSFEVVKEIKKEPIKICLEDLDRLIGKRIDRGVIVDILKSLGFDVTIVDETSIIVKTPVFRHDIENIQDIAEEIVRMYGIDNIDALPLEFKEKNRINLAYKRYKTKKELKAFSISKGYFETVSFVFTSKEFLEKYGFEIVREDRDLINPITNELNTLRTSLIPNLIMQAQNNVKNGKKSVKLFEIGIAFDKNRDEKELFSIIYSGFKEEDSFFNQGKPKEVDFEDIVRDLGGIIGDFELIKSLPKDGLSHPYQCGDIIKGGKVVGYVAKLHPNAQKDFDLPSTYFAQIELDKIDFNYPKFKGYSIYQTSFKDLSILVDKSLPFEDIKNSLSLPKEVKRFYLVDVYEDEKFEGKKSLTIRFAIQSDSKTLTEEEISSIIDNILKSLENIGAKLR